MSAENGCITIILRPCLGLLHSPSPVLSSLKHFIQEKQNLILSKKREENYYIPRQIRVYVQPLPSEQKKGDACILTQ